MIAWARFPFIRIVVPFIVGIALCYNIKGALDIPVWIPAFIIILLGVWMAIPSIKINYSGRWLFGILLNTALLLLGYGITSAIFLENISSHFSKVQSKELVYFARVTDLPSERAKSYKVPLEVFAVRDSLTNYASTGNVLGYLSKDSLTNVPDYGDVILFTKQPAKPQEPGNPGEFDYAGYLANRGIFHTVFLKKAEYGLYAGTDKNKLKVFALNTRERFLRILSENKVTGKELSVASALMTGYDELLDDNQRQQFSGAGVIHILCVSGLHVGIIFLMAEFLFGLVGRRRGLQVIKPIVIILLIWTYAVVTGLAPPVMRASLMFSVIIIRNAFQKQASVLNSLAMAAFFLLLFDPLLLFNVGFQLSFIAVSGIVTLQPLLRKILKPKHPMLRYLWDLATVSLAAQIVTAPLIIFYFHQFPSYFLFSNLVAVPLAGIIIYTGVLVISTSWIPLIAKSASWLLVNEIKVLNAFVEYIEQLPGAVISGLHLSTWIVAVMFIFIIAFFCWVIYNRKLFLYTALTGLLVMVAAGVLREMTITNQQFIVFHKVNKHPLISLVNGRDHIILTDRELYADISKVNYQLEGLKVMAGLNNPTLKCLFPDEILSHAKGETSNSCLPEFYSFLGKRIVIINNLCLIPEVGHTLNADYVLLCKNNKYSPGRIAACFPGARLITDASNSYRLIESITQEAEDNGIPVYCISKSGALIADIER